MGRIILDKSYLSILLLTVMLGVGFSLENRVFIIFILPILLASLLICLRISKRYVNLILVIMAVVGVALGGVLSQTQRFGNLIASARLDPTGTSLALGDTVFYEANVGGADRVDVERRLVTQVSIDSFYLSPIVGTGYMSTSYYVGRLTPYLTAAHGIPSEILGETGLLGAGLFLLLCMLSVRGYRRKLQYCATLDKPWMRLEILTLVASLAGGLFHQTNHDFYLYLFLGSGLSGLRLKKVRLLGSPQPTR